MSKFKVGDKVRILDGSKIENYTGSWDDDMNEYVGEVHEVMDLDEGWTNDSRTAYLLEDTEYFVWDERGLELVSQKIVITHDGKTTTAKLYNGKQVVKTATARCCPSDDFDFNIGASIAIERLIGQILGKVENTLFDWDGFKAGKFNVIVNRDSIDRFLEECEAHEINWSLHKATEFNPIKDFNKESSFVRALLQGIMDFDSTNECELEVVGEELVYSFKPEIKESTVTYD